ncbi:MAG: hypothetical protein PF437_01570 [Sulfurimonas sp.]|jgi:hypothetical protein|nr:hypothetical protein [Sulfurimonas sp.]
MSRLINLNKKNDPLKDWEVKDFIRRKESNVSFSDEHKTHNQSKPKVYESPQEISRIAEIMAIKDEIRKSLTSNLSCTSTQEKAAIEKRRQELLNIKKILRM